MNPLAATARDQKAQTGQVLCFRLAGQDYALDILRVKEIRRFSPTTSLPDVPRYVLGVINMRGTVVPVFDLRIRFSLGENTVDRNTAIIIVTVGTRFVGLVVDEVTRVLNVTADMVRPPPQLSSAVDASFLLGLLASGERLLTWLDVERLVEADLGSM